MPPDELGKGAHPRRRRRARATTSSSTSIDNGIGLPKENRSRLLEPYVTTREKGTGLGLAIVGKHSGRAWRRIELRDAADKIAGQRGAWMRLRFAASRQDEAPSRQPNRQHDAKRASGRMASDILIVDDEADIRELVAGILQDEGYATRTARDSDEALAAIASRRPQSGVPRHLAAGLQARRPAAARRHQAASIPNCRW